MPLHCAVTDKSGRKKNDDASDVRDIVHQAFTGLMDAWGYRMRWIKGVGMVIKVK